MIKKYLFALLMIISSISMAYPEININGKYILRWEGHEGSIYEIYTKRDGVPFVITTDNFFEMPRDLFCIILLEYRMGPDQKPRVVSIGRLCKI